jgi:putative Mg2+ transporter-C (MgtC) family protein
MPIQEFLFRLGLAFGLGILIGIERQYRQRLAGLRTNTLVSVGSALFIMLSESITGDASPSRVAAQIVSGIGFLGAGVIMKEGLNVKGLNTAATLWCSAAVGSLAGMGLWKEAGLGAGSIIFLHIALRPLAYFVNRRITQTDVLFTRYSIVIQTRSTSEAHIREILLHTLENEVFQLKSLQSKDDDTGRNVTIEADVQSEGKQDNLVEKIIGILVREKDVTGARWTVVERNSD